MVRACTAGAHANHRMEKATLLIRPVGVIDGETNQRQPAIELMEDGIHAGAWSLWEAELSLFV